jgi:hypothetical protein
MKPRAARPTLRTSPMEMLVGLVMDRVDVRLAKITGQKQRQFEIVVVDEDEELGWFGRLGARVLRFLRIID